MKFSNSHLCFKLVSTWTFYLSAIGSPLLLAPGLVRVTPVSQDECSAPFPSVISPFLSGNLHFLTGYYEGLVQKLLWPSFILDFAWRIRYCDFRSSKRGALHHCIRMLAQFYLHLQITDFLLFILDCLQHPLEVGREEKFLVEQKVRTTVSSHL